LCCVDAALAALRTHNSTRSSKAADGILNNPLLMWLLKALPIYPVWGQAFSGNAGTAFSSLLVPEIRLAPSSMNPNFLDHTFLKVRASDWQHVHSCCSGERMPSQRVVVSNCLCVVL
jgi:hypothetical protein